MTIIGAAVFFFRLDKGGLNIDFTGGTLYSGVLEQPADLKETLPQNALSPSKQEQLLKIEEVQEVDTEGAGLQLPALSSRATLTRLRWLCRIPIPPRT